MIKDLFCNTTRIDSGPQYTPCPLGAAYYGLILINRIYVIINNIDKPWDFYHLSNNTFLSLDKYKYNIIKIQKWYRKISNNRNLIKKLYFLFIIYTLNY